jgi:hypothetical protein
MAFTVTLTPELERRLTQQANHKGMTAKGYALQLLDKYLDFKDNKTELVALLQEWIDADDTEEQRETGDYLIRTLDNDRLSNRKLFPPELKGKTW